MKTRKEWIKHFGKEGIMCEKFATFLACVAFDKGKTCYEMKLGGITEGGVEKGNWTVTIQRTDSPCVDTVKALEECEYALRDTIRTGKIGLVQETAQKMAAEILKMNGRAKEKK